MVRQIFRSGLDRLLSVGVTMLLAACGGGGSSSVDGPVGMADADEQSTAASGPLAVTLEAPQRVAPGSDIGLRWQAQGGAVRFAVFVQHAAGFGFVPADAVITGHAARLKRGAAWRYDFPTAQVRVQGCNREGRCVHSEARPLTEVLLAGVVRVDAVGLGPDSLFSTRVALDGSGHTLMAAEPLDGRANDPAFPGKGSIFHFDRSAEGAWTQQARLERFTVRNSFGERMALSSDGSTLAVGVPADVGQVGGINAPEVGAGIPSGMPDGRGGVHIYVRSPGGPWQHQAFLKAAETRYNEQVGLGVSLSANGNRLLAGSQERTLLFTREGSRWREDWVFERRRPGGVWLGPGAVISGDGLSVAIRASGGFEGENATTGYLAVHVFRPCPCATGWRRVADLRSSKPMQMPDFVDSDEFGAGLAFSHDGRILAVSAALDRGNAQDQGDGGTGEVSRSGAVYVFARGEGDAWERQAFLKARAAEVGDEMGNGVAISADGRVIVARACGLAANAGGVRRNHAEGAQPGLGSDVDCAFYGASAYVFERSADGQWSHVAAVVPAPNELVSAAFFSFALSADAQTLAFGAITFSLTGRDGRVIVY